MRLKIIKELTRLDSTATVTDTISLMRVCEERRREVVSSAAGMMEGKKEECENRRSQYQSQIEGREKQKKTKKGKKSSKRGKQKLV